MAYYVGGVYYDGSAPLFGAGYREKPGWEPWNTPGGGGGGVKLYFVNKVWDPGGGFPEWVRWETEDAPDPSGAFYPDPFGSGFGTCSFFRVESSRYE